VSAVTAGQAPLTDGAAPSASGIVRRHRVDCEDPFVTAAEPAVAQRIAALGELGAAYVRDQAAAAGRRRRPHRGLDLANPATAALVAENPATGDWLALAPSALALEPLYNPELVALPGGRPVDPGFREMCRNALDARGIRSRGHVWTRLLVDQAKATPERHQYWLSLASGTAGPVLAAVQAVRALGLPAPHVTLADIDREALAGARRRAAELGLKVEAGLSGWADSGTVTTVRLNLLGARGFAHLGQFDAVDAVGLLEYLRPADWRYTYRGLIRTRLRMAGAIEFLRRAGAALAPGGRLVTSNMLADRPQLDFALHVVQWPHIKPRSVEQVSGLLEAAGLAWPVDVYLPADGVYAIYTLRRPAVTP
jgi:SAM-dependent methyltransferase